MAMSLTSNTVPEACAPVVDTPTLVDNLPGEPIDTPTKEIETGTAALVKVQPGPKRMSLWDGMVLMITPATNDEEKADELKAQATALRRRICLIGFAVLALVSLIIGLSVGLTSEHVDKSSTGIAASDESFESSNQRKPKSETPTTAPQVAQAYRNTSSPTPTIQPSNSTNGSSSSSSPTTKSPSPTSPTPIASTYSPQTTKPATTAPTPCPTTRPATTTRQPTPAPTPALTKTMNFVNRCSYPIQLYRVDLFICTMQPNGQCTDMIYNGQHTMYRHTQSAQATLVELTMDGGKLWYDLSIIPPGCGNGHSWNECMAVNGGKNGFNVPASIKPTKYEGLWTSNCWSVTCLEDQCPGAYLYPFDDTKMKDCPDDELFIVTFCPPA